MRHTIPAVEIITCDRCQKDSKQVRFGFNARIQIQANILDAAGKPASLKRLEIDLCDDCSRVFQKTLEEVMNGVDKSRSQ